MSRVPFGALARHVAVRKLPAAASEVTDLVRICFPWRRGSLPWRRHFPIMVRVTPVICAVSSFRRARREWPPELELTDGPHLLEVLRTLVSAASEEQVQMLECEIGPLPSLTDSSSRPSPVQE